MIDAIDSFIEKKQYEFPEYTEEQLRKVCESLFVLTKNKIEEGNLEEIRLKYFGTFKVFNGTVKTLTKKIENGTKLQDNKEHYLKMIDKYLKDDKKRKHKKIDE